MPRSASSAGGREDVGWVGAWRPRVRTAGCSRSSSWSPMRSAARAIARPFCRSHASRYPMRPSQWAESALASMPGTIAGAARATVLRTGRRTRHPAQMQTPWTSGSTSFPHLFEPTTIGGARIRNRIVSSGHDTVMAVDGLVTDRLVAYQEARARGGAGLIVIQVAGVHPTARYTSSELTADTDESIPGFTTLAEAIHRHGATVFGQLFHGGREIMDTADGTLAVAWAPSAVPTERFHVMPRAMGGALIAEIIDGFGAAAERLEAAGLDGVEVVASHGYLPSQFLNPRTNLRTDAWGGDPTGRLRFLREALAACPAGTSARVRGGAADLDRRGHARGADRGGGAGGARRAWTPTGRWTT